MRGLTGRDRGWGSYVDWELCGGMGFVGWGWVLARVRGGLGAEVGDGGGCDAG
jgi:hypothetical protein